tara:strand:- start:115 stop:240 length:126 start_codon:yes stop_codon:yes gene_type:complete
MDQGRALYQKVISPKTNNPKEPKIATWGHNFMRAGAYNNKL